MFPKNATTVPGGPTGGSLNFKAYIITWHRKTINRRENSPTALGENSHHKTASQFPVNSRETWPISAAFLRTAIRITANAGVGDFSNTLPILWATQVFSARFGLAGGATIAMLFYVGYNVVYTVSRHPANPFVEF